MFLAPCAIALLLAPQLSPVTTTFGTPPMVLRSDWFQLTPDGKYVTDGRTWIDLATENVVPWPVRVCGEELHAVFGEDKWVYYTMLANENWVRWAPETTTLLSGKTGEVLSTVEARVSALDPTGRLLARQEVSTEKKQKKVSVQVAEWPKAGEKPKWRTLVEHDGEMVDATFDRTGAHLAWHEREPEYTHDDDVYVHDLKTGKTVRLKIEDKSLSTYSLALAPGGMTVAVVRQHETHLLDVPSGKTLRTVPHPGPEHGEVYPTAVFTPDGESVLVGGLRLRRIERIPRDPKLKPGSIDVSDGDGVYGFAVTPDSKRVVVRDHGGVVRVYDLATGKRLDGGTHDTWQGVAWAGDHTTVCWSGRGRVALWDTRTGKIEREFAFGRPVEKSHGVNELTLSPDGRMAAVEERVIGDESDLIVYDLNTGKAVWELPDGFSSFGVTFHPDGDKIGVDTYDRRKTNGGDRFRTFDLSGKKGKELRAFPSKQGDYWFSDDGRSVFRTLNVQLTQLVECYEAASGERRWIWERTVADKLGSAGQLLRVDAVEKLVCMAAEGHVVGLDLVTGKLRWSIESLPTHWDGPQFACTPDGRWLAARLEIRNDKKLEHEAFALYDLRTQEGRDCPLVSPPLPRPVQQMALSPDGQRLITLTADGEQTVWDLNRLRRMTEPWAHLWDGLSGEAGPAATAMSRLLAAPDWAVTLLGEKLPPVAEANQADVKRWVGELGSPDFKTRDAAEKSLVAVLDPARKLIRTAAEHPANEEAADRLEQLVKKIDGLVGQPEYLRVSRSVEVVERLRTPAAVKLLERWAGGAPEALLTTEAKASLRRVKR